MINDRKLVTSETQRTGASLDVNQQEGTITIKVGTNLDLGIHDLFMKAAMHAQSSIRNRIVVDLDKTQRIFDSGLALLRQLDIRSWRKSCKVRIINCTPDLVQRIEQGLVPGMFNLSQAQQRNDYRTTGDTGF
jgi:anti-anti-sigma regulatory factor